MEPHDAIASLAKMISREFKGRDGLPPAELFEELLGNFPDAEIHVMEALIAETQKAKPQAKVSEVLTEMLFSLSDVLRRQIDARKAAAKATFAAMCDVLRRHATAGTLPYNAFIAINQCFARAKLDPGEDIRALSQPLVEQPASLPAKSRRTRHPGPEEAFDPQQLIDTFAALAKDLGDDPFLTFSQADEMLSAMPEEAKAMLCEMVAASGEGAVGEASIGFLLDRSDMVARAAMAGITQSLSKGGVSQASARRLVWMRNWLPVGRQPEFDTFLKALRTKMASGNPPAAANPAAEGADIFLSSCDGAGAQTMFARCKAGRKFVIATILIKHGFGIRDAMVLPPMGKRDVDGMMAEMAGQLSACPSTAEIAALLIDHALADNITSGENPPFVLMGALEIAGFGMRVARHTPTQGLIDSLLADVPENRKTAKAVLACVRRSARWPEENPIVASWFDDIDAVAELLSRKPKAKRAGILLAELLPKRREHWAHILAWTAHSLRHGPDATEFADYALVAREILAGCDLADMPVMQYIAQTTATAYAMK